MADITHSTIHNETVNLHCAHRGEGELILFLHGFPECWVQWKDLLLHFGENYLAAAPDLRGYNLSDRPGDLSQYTRERLLSDIGAIADHFQAETFTLVAHDWGGVLAWYYAAAHTERLKKLVILNAPHPVRFRELLATDARQQKASAYIQTLAHPESPTLLQANGFEFLRTKTFKDLAAKKLFSDLDWEEYLHAWRQPDALLSMTHYYRADLLGMKEVKSQGADPWLKADGAPKPIPTPTLILWGELDRYLIEENLIGLDAYLANLQIVKLPGVSHWIVQEAKEDVIRNLEAFLTT